MIDSDKSSSVTIIGLFVALFVITLAIAWSIGEEEPTFGTNPESKPLVFIVGENETLDATNDDGSGFRDFCMDGHYTKVFTSSGGQLERIEYVPIESC